MISKNKIAILQDRAELLSQARAFFKNLNIVEVDCPIITKFASVDAHIDLIPSFYSGLETRYLHSSPEYGMKRLLAKGMGDIYQLSHVFRDGECGHKHNPEFMMAEWYRIGISFEEMMHETCDFISLFLGKVKREVFSYREVFEKFAGFDYLYANNGDLLNYLKTNNIEVYPEILNEGKDALLNLILGTIIEPQLGLEGLCVLAYYPASQAALAQTQIREDETVAERFEVYYKGIELANGYHELANAAEQRDRLNEANKHRLLLQKNSLPIDEYFLEALAKGIPDCCGVAVGFDRLMMLRHNAKHISQVIPFDWFTA